MTNFDLAEQVIMLCVQKGHSPRRIAESLADCGLLAPDLPAPDLSFPSGEKEWSVMDGYVNLDGGEIAVAYDEETFLTPEPGHILITHTGNARLIAYCILAACDRKDAHDDQL